MPAEDYIPWGPDLFDQDECDYAYRRRWQRDDREFEPR